MTLTNNSMFAGALALLALITSSAQGSIPGTLVVEQQFDNPHCRGTPVIQEVTSLPDNTCLPLSAGPGAYVNVIDISSGNVVASHVDSLSYTCDSPNTLTGHNCEKHLHKTVGSYCLAVYENNQFAGAIRVSCYPCRPFPTITKAHCNRLIHQCENYELIDFDVVTPFPVEMKWTGRGCREDGKPLGDGGCQCDGYCGYTCERACNADSQCYWDTNTNQCFSAETNTPGEPIKYCLPQGEYEIELQSNAGAKKPALSLFGKSKP